MGIGVVDNDYWGEVGVILFNQLIVDFPIKVGDRIAQLILEKIKTLDVKDVKVLGETNWDKGGFGSTGMQSRDQEDSAQKNIKMSLILLQMQLMEIRG